MSEETTQNPQDNEEAKKRKNGNWGLTTRWGHGQEQPSSESKKAGWAKRRRNRELAQYLLGLQFVGKEGYKESVAKYFGLSLEEVSEMSNEAMIMLKQIGLAIERGDQEAARQLMERAYGKPKEYLKLTDGEDDKPVININVVHLSDNHIPIKENENDEEIQQGDIQ